MKIMPFLPVMIAFIALSTASFAQCSCSCSAGGSLFGDYSGSAVNEKKKFTLESSYDYRAFKSHLHTSQHVHNSHGTAHAEEAGIEMNGMSTAALGVRYGLTKRVAIITSLPFAVLHAPSAGENGIGDLSFAGVYRFITADRFALSTLAGVELPTGKQVAQNLASDVVIGSGSYDAFAGLVAVYSKQKILLRINSSYKYNTVGLNHIHYGGTFTSSLSFGYSNKANESLCTPPMEKKTTWQVNAIGLVEQNGTTYTKDVMNKNSGGIIVYGGAGVSIAVAKVMVPFSILIPVYQRLNGEQHQTSYRFRIGAALSL